MPRLTGGLRENGRYACGSCPARWSAERIAHCSACHRSFAVADLFDRHRQGYGQHGRCLDPAQLRNEHGDPIMFLDRGVWQDSGDRITGKSTEESDLAVKGFIGHTPSHPLGSSQLPPRRGATSMAREIQETVIDDLEKARGHRVPATQTIDFSFDGKRYVVDLSEVNAAHLRNAVQPFVDVATLQTGTGRRANAEKKAPTTREGGTKDGKVRPDRERTEAIRLWARLNNFEVSDRGRIPGEVIAAYEAAGSPSLSTLRPTTAGQTEQSQPPIAGWDESEPQATSAPAADFSDSDDVNEEVPNEFAGI